jgi:tetratricopeptide (TPR) repeat protein
MKSERRHELQNNDLVAFAEKYADDVKPHAKKIVGIAIVVAVGLLAMMLMRSRGASAAKSGWTNYFAAVNQSDLEGLYEVAKKYPRSAAGAWALQSAGDINLATGTVDMYSDRERAKERFTKALENYSSAGKRVSDELLQQRSLMGLAQTHEALNEFDKAEGCYNSVMKKWPDTSVSKLAGQRLAVLKNPETKEFYDWFLAQEVTPPADPLEGMGLKAPSIYDDLPGDPSLTAPSADALQGERNNIQPPEEAIDETPVPDMPSEGEIEGGVETSTNDDSAGGNFDTEAAVEEMTTDAVEAVESVESAATTSETPVVEPAVPATGPE